MGSLSKHMLVSIRLGSEERAERPAGGLNAALLTSVEWPAAIRVLQFAQKRKTFAAQSLAAQFKRSRRAIQRILHFENAIVALGIAEPSKTMRWRGSAHSLHNGAERRMIRLFSRNVSLFLLNFKLMDQAMEIAAGDSQRASAFRFTPSIFAKRA